MAMENQNPETPWWRSRTGAAALGFLAVIGFFLAVEHRAHLFGILPLLFLLMCPLVHFFHHGGHGGHDHGADEKASQTEVRR